MRLVYIAMQTAISAFVVLSLLTAHCHAKDSEMPILADRVSTPKEIVFWGLERNSQSALFAYQEEPPRLEKLTTIGSEWSPVFADVTKQQWVGINGDTACSMSFGGATLWSTSCNDIYAIGHRKVGFLRYEDAYYRIDLTNGHRHPIELKWDECAVFDIGGLMVFDDHRTDWDNWSVARDPERKALFSVRKIERWIVTPVACEQAVCWSEGARILRRFDRSSGMEKWRRPCQDTHDVYNIVSLDCKELVVLWFDPMDHAFFRLLWIDLDTGDVSLSVDLNDHPNCFLIGRDRLLWDSSELRSLSDLKVLSRIGYVQNE